jgi:IclR family transcriptional regulator, acetate operon repressor
MSHIPAERCLDIIELLADGATTLPLGEIAEQLKLPKSGAHRLLATLVELGWAEQNGDTGFYRLTMRLAILGQRFYVATGIPDICQPLLDLLAARSGEFARLAIVDGGTLTWLAHAQGATGGLLYQPLLGINTVPLHVTATGKAWLSSLPREVALQHVLKSGFKGKFGPNAIGSIEKLMAELDSTAQRGFGLAVNEAEPGVTAVATVIRAEATGVALGTVSIAGPSVRMTAHRVEELGLLVIQAAAELASLWPLRPRSSKPLNRRNFAEA